MFLICLALVGMMADGARAQTANLYLTYWEDDRGVTEQVGVVEGVYPPTTLYLWVEGGGTPSTTTPCLPAATGDEFVGPFMGARQRMLSVLDHFVGGVTSVKIPVPSFRHPIP